MSAVALVAATTLCFSASAGESSFESWLSFQRDQSRAGMMANISPRGTALGVVVASPSRDNPDYYYHWIRDAALVMGSVMSLAENSAATKEQMSLEDLMWDYVRLSRRNQTTPNRSGGLGEPKFDVDGSAFDGDWGRPQNDGPALRAITLIRFARHLERQGRLTPQLRAQLYQAELPARSVIKADLEYVAHNWRDKSFDLWEEVYGQHFYTRMVQRRALLDGADFAEFYSDSEAAAFYRDQAKALEQEISKHWDSQAGYVRITRDSDSQDHRKPSDLDVGVVLGALHGGRNDGFFDLGSDKILATAEKIRASFERIYGINQNSSAATAIGRYPEDTYDGYSTKGTGNAWVLATNAYAELHYSLAALIKQRGSFTVTARNLPFLKALNSPFAKILSVGQKFTKGQSEFTALLGSLHDQGDAYLARVRKHANPDGSLSEQMNRDTGYMQGAPNLTWSHASFLTAILAR